MLHLKDLKTVECRYVAIAGSYNHASPVTV